MQSINKYSLSPEGFLIANRQIWTSDCGQRSLIETVHVVSWNMAMKRTVFLVMALAPAGK